MLPVFVGLPLPFLILAAFTIGSYVCAQIIASDDQPLANSACGGLERMENDIQHHETIREIRKSVHVPAFITGGANGLTAKLCERLRGGLSSVSMSNVLEKSPTLSYHYTTPPTSIEALRKRFGTSSFWGDWSPQETRLFYKQQLPKALQIDGALGLSLEQRAEIASANRHALRLYARERCHLPARIMARLYDGVRHLHVFGTWNSDGMTWDEVKQKYSMEARRLGYENEDEILLYVHKRIVDKSSATNMVFDNIAMSSSSIADSNQFVFLLLKSIIESPKIRTKRKLWDRLNSSSEKLSESSSSAARFNIKLSGIKKINSIVPQLFSI